ncbi:hypothetical protein [Streptomyces triticiradicis]|uniref:hypothetical protein n=1 Tax=Streptomyces triticiradicis TaxID=2651189 RepID=UPI001788C863|nr:hypothetical protein [Streptomyces triticiradicis]
MPRAVHADGAADAYVDEEFAVEAEDFRGEHGRGVRTATRVSPPGASAVLVGIYRPRVTCSG